MEGNLIINHSIFNPILFYQQDDHMVISIDEHTPLKKDIELVIDCCKRYLSIPEKELKEYESQITQKKQINNIKSKEKIINKTSGFIYFLQDDMKRIKIGKTINLNRRIFDLNVKLPSPLKLIHYIKSEDIDKEEKQIHQKYSKHRLQGEWFNLPKGTIKFIKEYPSTWMLRRS